MCQWEDAHTSTPDLSLTHKIHSLYFSLCFAMQVFMNLFFSPYTSVNANKVCSVGLTLSLNSMLSASYLWHTSCHLSWEACLVPHSCDPLLSCINDFTHSDCLALGPQALIKACISALILENMVMFEPCFFFFFFLCLWLSVILSSVFFLTLSSPHPGLSALILEPHVRAYTATA